MKEVHDATRDLKPGNVGLEVEEVEAFDVQGRVAVQQLGPPRSRWMKRLTLGLLMMPLEDTTAGLWLRKLSALTNP
jgi:hypothetical protein